MTATGKAKYYTVHAPLTDEQLHAHLLGQATYAVPLIGTDELASAGLIEQDAGGIDMARRILAAAEARGVVMFAIVCRGSDGHDGCHPWALYDGRYDPKSICMQLRTIAEDAGASTGEIHPNKTNIRLPFGLHLRSNTRGRLVLQSGETFNLDKELEAAENAVQALPLNAAPPNLVDNVNQVKNTVNIVNSVPRRIVNLSGRASLPEVKARFNAEHTLESLLADYGAVKVRGGYTCPCGVPHTHTPTLYISEKGKLFSFSPRCKLHTTKGWDAFGFYVKTQHNDDVVAALKTLNPITRRNVRREDAPLTEPEPRYTQEQRDAYNAARREKRHAETRQALTSLYDQVNEIDLSDRARLLFAYLHDLCNQRGVLQAAPTNEQISVDLDMCKRYVQYAFRELEATGLGKRQGGRNVEQNEAATWTFYRMPYLGCKAHQDAECTLSILESDLVPTLDLVSAAPPDSPDEAGAFDTDACDDGVLTWLYEQEREGRQVNDPSPAESPATTQPAERMALVEKLEAMSDDDLRAWIYRGKNTPREEPEAETTDAMSAVSGASYTPVELPDRPYTGQSKRHMDHEMRLAFVRESMRPRTQPPGTVNLLAHGDPDADDPLVRCAPSDPKAAREYYALKNKKATSAKQAIWMRRRIAELEVLMPLSERAALPARGSPAPARRAAVAQQGALL